MRRFGWGLLGIVLLGLGFWLGRMPGMGSKSDASTRALPLVLRQVQSLGELHTAKFAYENVFEHETHLRPQGVFAAMPGADVVVENATRNRVLMSAAGTVEAGVDLREARIEAKRIVLPPIVIFTPKVTARVHRAQSGMFWRDDNVSLSAVQDAETRMRSAAEEQGIRAHAAKEALAQVRRLVPTDVEVVFAGAQA